MNPVCVRVIWVESRVARLLQLFQRHFVFQRDTVGYFHPFRKLSYMGKPCTKLKTKQNVLVWQHNRSWIFYYSEVATEPPMDLLISKLVSPYRLAWHSLNKAVSLSLQRCWPGSVTDTFQVCHANGSGFVSHLDALCFCNSDCLHVSIHVDSWDQFFFTFVKTFPNFCFWGYI